METNLTIKNFRVFDDKGVTVEIDPLTFLVGCNSSGKSSILKAIILLNSYISQIRHYDGQNKPHFDFANPFLSQLGTFESVINKQSLSKGNNSCSFSYQLYNSYLGKTLNVEWTFSLNEEDSLKQEELSSMVIRCDNSLIFQASSLDDIKYYLDYKMIRPKYLSINGQLSSLKSPLFTLLNTLSLIEQYEFPEMLSSKKLFPEISKYVPGLTLEWLNNILSEGLFDSWSIPQKHYEAIEKAVQTGILFYLPILDKLDKIPKSSFKNSFISWLDKDYAYPKTINKIIDSYIYSEYSIFSSYYLSMEDEYLNSSGLGRIVSNTYTEDPSEGQYYDNNHFEEVSIDPDADNHCFEIMFMTLCGLDNHSSSFVDIEHIMGTKDYHHYMYDYIIKYRDTIIKRSLFSDLFQNISYVSSSRAVTKRVYLQGYDEFSNILSGYIDAKRSSKDQKYFRKYTPGAFLNRWVNKFEIGNKVEFKPLGEGIGFTIIFYDNDNKGWLIADLGYGISQLVSIIIEIETAIISNNGLAVNRKKTIAIEEPEIHLHPKFQSLLAEMFYEAYNEYGIQFIIETHSEYLLRKIQTIVKAQKLSPKDVSIIYVEDDNQVNQGAKKVRRIPVKEDGNLADWFGYGFYDEAAKLQLELLYKGK